MSEQELPFKKAYYCHTCKRRLVFSNYEYTFNGKLQIYQCPSIHSELVFDKDLNVIGYGLYYDSDDLATERFFLQASNHTKQTSLYKHEAGRKKSLMVTLEKVLPINIQNGYIQYDKDIVYKLMKLKAFA